MASVSASPNPITFPQSVPAQRIQSVSPVASPTPLGKPPVGLSPALSDFIEFQTMIASSKNLHFKDQNRVSVAKTSFLSAALTTALTIVPTTWSAINGQGDKLVLVPILATFAAIHGAALGLLLNHNRD